MINVGCLFLLLTCALLASYMLKTQGLFALTVISGVFSTCTALLYTLLGAPDVGLTESAVGAGLYTLLSLVTIFLVKHVFDHPSVEEHKPLNTHKYRVGNLRFRYVFASLGVLTLCVITCSLKEFPAFGAISNPPINESYFIYLGESFDLYHINNAVTMLLGSFRGLDTLLETLVIFLSAIVILAVLSTVKGRGVEDPEEEQLKSNDTSANKH